jgi:hypothetical protein
MRVLVYKATGRAVEIGDDVQVLGHTYIVGGFGESTAVSSDPYVVLISEGSRGNYAVHPLTINAHYVKMDEDTIDWVRAANKLVKEGEAMSTGGHFKSNLGRAYTHLAKALHHADSNNRVLLLRDFSHVFVKHLLPEELEQWLKTKVPGKRLSEFEVSASLVYAMPGIALRATAVADLTSALNRLLQEK